jgi:phosphomannomutase
VNKFIFDVDGTLTPSRQKIDTNFAVFFTDFCAENDVYLVTGSDKEKTIQQLGEEIYSLAQRVYNCSGCDVWEGETHIRSNKWTLNKKTRSWLQNWLKESTFPLRTGLHIEERPGMINFSIVGRNATLGERKLYVKHDIENEERDVIAAQFNAEFPNLIARPGGETGIDISPMGSDKSQILQDFDKQNDFIYFYGDRMDFLGNDYPLKMKLLTGKWRCSTVEVNGWKQTWEKLKCI